MLDLNVMHTANPTQIGRLRTKSQPSSFSSITASIEDIAPLTTPFFTGDVIKHLARQAHASRELNTSAVTLCRWECHDMYISMYNLVASRPQ